MSTKRAAMREKAKQQLGETSDSSTSKIKPKKEKTPSFFMGFWLIFLGMFATVFFFSIGQTFIGIFAGAPFIIMGTVRITRATTKNRPATMT